jgi:NADPH:quinone reductase-like Zn-dependent oxidoreductase
VIEDFIGASYLARHLKVLKTGGRLVLVALMGGHKAEIELSTVLRKRLTILSVLMRSRPIADKRKIAQRFARRWLPLLQQGELKPIIDRQFTMQAIQAAHQYMENSQHFGKIVLSMP